jgi:hypothetical protein
MPVRKLFTKKQVMRVQKRLAEQGIDLDQFDLQSGSGDISPEEYIKGETGQGFSTMDEKTAASLGYFEMEADQAKKEDKEYKAYQKKMRSAYEAERASQKYAKHKTVAEKEVASYLRRKQLKALKAREKHEKNLVREIQGKKKLTRAEREELLAGARKGFVKEQTARLSKLNVIAREYQTGKLPKEAKKEITQKLREDRLIKKELRTLSLLKTLLNLFTLQINQ